MMKRSYSELLRVKRDTELAERGADVLEKMENALTKEQLELQRKTTEMEEACKRLMDEIAGELRTASAESVMTDIERMIATEPLDNQASVENVKKFGKLVEHLRAVPGPAPEPRWGAPFSYERARGLAKELGRALIELGNAQTDKAFIDAELAKTRRRVNALRKVIVPDLESRKKSLEEWIDEETREELGRRRWVEGVASS
jgi:V/A-type H+-transporting ATPase subunit D